MDQPFEIVRSGYDAIGERYSAGSSDWTVRLTWVPRLLQQLRDGSTVVDLGCGPGEPATRMLAERHRVVGVDGSWEQLRLAQVAAPTATFLQADMTRLNFLPSSLDAVASFYAFGHIPPSRHAPLLRAITAWLKPGGLLLTNTPEGAGEGLEADWLGVPMFFGGIGEAATRQALIDLDLTVLEWEVVPEVEDDGNTVRFLWLLAQKSM